MPPRSLTSWRKDIIGGKIDDIYYFYTLDGGTIILLTVENTGILVVYMDFTDFTETKTSDAAISSFESFRQQTMFKWKKADLPKKSAFFRETQA